MGLEWIDLTRGEGVSTLQIGDDRLTVVGNLPHGIDIAPRSVDDARRLIEWCAAWIAREDPPHVPEPGPELPHVCASQYEPAPTPERVTCGGCGAQWCERCDPAPSAMCHTCNGRGHSTAPIREGDPEPHDD